MRRRGPSLKGKFMLALLVSAALPFLIGLATFETTGFRYFLDERGKFHQTQAAHLARSLGQASDAYADVLQTWLAADPTLLNGIVESNRASSGIPSAELARRTDQIDALWPSMPDDDPEVAPILQNPAAASLRRFIAMHPAVVEILATDAHGRLVAASGRTSDYNQADEEWWWEGSALYPGHRWTDVPRFDASSGVYTIDVALPLFDDGELAGVVKLLADVSSMFAKLGASLGDDGLWKIILPDGSILASSGNEHIPKGGKISAQTLRDIVANRDHWFLEQDATGDAWMTGVAALPAPIPMESAYVLFSSRRDDVVAPLQQRFLQIGAVAIMVLVLCTMIGFAVLHKNILQPLATLARASREIADGTRLRFPGHRNHAEIKDHFNETMSHLRSIEAIRTGDEIEDLAADFAEMGETVLRYQQETETRLAAENPDSPAPPQ